jgi:hypothetical protein
MIQSPTSIPVTAYLSDEVHDACKGTQHQIIYQHYFSYITITYTESHVR